MPCTPGRIGCRNESHVTAIEHQGESVRAILWDGETPSDTSVPHTRLTKNTWDNTGPSTMSDLTMDVEEHIETGYNYYDIFKGHGGLGLGLRNLWNQDASVLCPDTNRDDPWSTLNTHGTHNHTPYIPIQLAGRIVQKSGSNASLVSYAGYTELDSTVSNGFDTSTITTSVDEEDISILQSTSTNQSKKNHPEDTWAQGLPRTPPGSLAPSTPDYDIDAIGSSSGRVCPYENCKAQFIGPHYRENLDKHLQTQHAISKTFRCWEMGCGMVFRRKDTQLAHIRRHHPGLAPSPAVCFDPRLVNSSNERKPPTNLVGTWITPETEDAGFEVLSDSGRYSELTSVQSSKHARKGHDIYPCPKIIDPPVQSAPVVQTIENVSLGTLECAPGGHAQMHRTVQDISNENPQVEDYSPTDDQNSSTLSLSYTCPNIQRDSHELQQDGVRTASNFSDHENQLEPITNKFSPGLGSGHSDASYCPVEDMEVVLDETQHNIVEQAMERFYDWFAHHGAGVLWPEEIAPHSVESRSGCSDGLVRDHTVGTSSGACASGDRGGEQQQTTLQPSNVLGKRKVGNIRESSDDNNDEEYPNKHPQQDSKSKSHCKITPRFACPFFKRNPERQKRPSCFSSGFENITRVKQHIYRTHQQVLLCPRCDATVGDHQGLMKHLNIVGQCDPANRKHTAMKHDSQDKINQIKVEEIRKPSPRGLTEPEKWASLYRLIFNLEENAETPSPYYEHPSTHHSSTTNSVSSRDSSWKEVYNDKLPLIMQDLITRAVNEAVTSLRENLNAQIPGFLKTAHQLSLQEAEASTRSNESLGLRSQSSSSRDPPNIPSYADCLLGPSSRAAISTDHIMPPSSAAQIDHISPLLSQSPIPPPWPRSTRKSEHHSTSSSNESSVPTKQPFSQQITDPCKFRAPKFSEPNLTAQICGHSLPMTSCDSSTSSRGQRNEVVGIQIASLETDTYSHLPKSIDNTPTMSLASNTTMEDMSFNWLGDRTCAPTDDMSPTPPPRPPVLLDPSSLPPVSDTLLRPYSNSEDKHDHTLTDSNSSSINFNIEEPGILLDLYPDPLFELPQSPNWFSPPDEV